MKGNRSTDRKRLEELLVHEGRTPFMSEAETSHVYSAHPNLRRSDLVFDRISKVQAKSMPKEHGA